MAAVMPAILDQAGNHCAMRRTKRAFENRQRLTRSRFGCSVILLITINLRQAIKTFGEPHVLGSEFLRLLHCSKKERLGLRVAALLQGARSIVVLQSPAILFGRCLLQQNEAAANSRHGTDCAGLQPLQRGLKFAAEAGLVHYPHIPGSRRGGICRVGHGDRFERCARLDSRTKRNSLTLGRNNNQTEAAPCRL